MGSLNGLGWTFDTVAERYEKLRPGYTEEMYSDIFSFCNMNLGRKALEIGIGGGQATKPFLDKGFNVTAVEYGKNFCDLCSKKFVSYAFNAVNCRFEDYRCDSNTYDIVYSASAFHWIPEALGYSKVYDLLKSGGVFARFANHPYKDKGREDVYKAIQNVYSVYMPGSVPSGEYGEEEALKRSDICKAYGFTDACFKLYKRTRTFTAKQYADLLGTYSDHISIEENKRKMFMNDIIDAIDLYGGKITIYDTIDLELARKP